MKTQTFIVWNMYEEIKYGVVDYDARHLNNKYINSTETTDIEDAQLNDLDTAADWFDNVQEWAEALREVPILDTCFAIECGFIP